MHIDQANISNLKKLWTKYGSQPLMSGSLSGLLLPLPLALPFASGIRKKVTKTQLPNIQLNTHWPHRCWIEDTRAFSDFTWLKFLPETTIFPVWTELNEVAELSLIDKQLKQNNWFCLFEQTAMYFSLTTEKSTLKASKIKSHNGFELTKVLTPNDITLWVNIVADSFGYTIDRVVIEKLINDQDMQILMAFHNNQAIATAILYKTGDVIGVHQVGVKQSFQGKGYARILMQEIIALSLLWQGKHIVLQASAAGRPLYESLGFKSQFLIKNYKKQCNTMKKN